MSIRSDWIWMDGEQVPFDEAKVHVLCHTLHYGLGVFEGIRSYEQDPGRGGVFRLDEHVRRFIESASMCQLTLPYGFDEIRDACIETLRLNRMTEAYIRPLAFYGSEAMGLGARNNTVHVTIAVWRWGAYLGEEGLKRGIRAGTSSFTRHNVNSSLQRAKVVGQYVNSILARYEANDHGYDEAIMLDSRGFVAEGTGENIFVIRDGVVSTPPVTNILGGITRETALSILRHEGYEVRETFFGRDALYAADEIFMTGTAAEITPIREVDRRQVGTGSPGPVTQRVQDLYLSGVHGDVDWITPWITPFSVE